MGWPKLVPKAFCRTPIILTIYQEGIDEDGAPIEECTQELMCNYQDKATTVLTTEQKKVQITGKAYFDGDICPGIPVISGGKAVVFGEERKIAAGSKGRNPDGTVNFTEVDLL